ncbi:hypothetical protein LH128_22969 [Sphingomonas sp. LH128]|nr:hypothetical protein LH128_22969 [Sphingomonas sp. LH128]
MEFIDAKGLARCDLAPRNPVALKLWVVANDSLDREQFRGGRSEGETVRGSSDRDYSAFPFQELCGRFCQDIKLGRLHRTIAEDQDQKATTSFAAGQKRGGERLRALVGSNDMESDLERT